MKKKLIISTGFALFSMFFGSGNLVFPLVVGTECGEHWLSATLGILLTGVVVPFLGVFGMMAYQGSFESFFGYFGKRAPFLFSLVMLALLGPFGVIARCLTVIHGALQPFFPRLLLIETSCVMCLVIYILTVNKQRIVTILGTFLTPFLLLSIAAIAFFGLQQGIAEGSTTLRSWEALKSGFFQGYQTMDLLAAFFFSTFIINHLQHALPTSEKAQQRKVFIAASLIGAAILSLVYCALIVLGSQYAPALTNVPPQEMLGRIAAFALGPMAAPCVCLAVILACLTTAIVLASLFAEFLRKEVACEKIGSKCALVITLVIGFCVSTLEFAGIARFLGPILETVYPVLIALTVINILRKVRKNSVVVEVP